MKVTAKDYEEMINLEALDRWLNDDVSRFMSRGDREGAQLAELARREVQNRMYQIVMKDENKED